MDFSLAGVVGAGTMGHGIAQVFLRHGFFVTLSDISEERLARGAEKILCGLKRDVEKGRLGEQEKKEAVERLKTTTRLCDLAPADLVIEAVAEDFGAKASVFRALDSIGRPEMIFASNTSSISITKLAAVTRRPSSVIGMHFFNPVPVMALVEVVRGMATSDATFAAVQALAVRLGKTPVEVNDAPGFVSNRVLMPLINEAAFAVMEGVATAESVDQVFKLGMAHPMGPLTLADFIGLDVCVDILRVLHEGFGDPKYRPCPLLVRMVDAGWLGRKSGRGFHSYER